MPRELYFMGIQALSFLDTSCNFLNKGYEKA